MDRTLAMAGRLRRAVRELEVERVRFVATSASRDAAQRRRVRRRRAHGLLGVGIAPEVVTGDEEAALSFPGATGGLQAHGVDGPYLVVDLGGGSTEFVRGTADGRRRPGRSTSAASG